MTDHRDITVRVPFRRTRFVALALALGATCMIVANALATSPAPQARHARSTGRRNPISVFAHRPHGVARVARASAARAPAGSVLARVVGRTELYVRRNADRDDCVMDLTVNASGGSVCAPASQVEENGEVGVSMEGEGATAPGSPATLRVSALVPDGVSNIKVTDRDGSSYLVPVANNVAGAEDTEIAFVSYTVPGGTIESTNVAALVAHTPRQPGAPGSARTANG